VDPSPTPSEREPASGSTVPVVADLLKATAEQFQFTPQRPANEIEFKRAYAAQAAAAGLTRSRRCGSFRSRTGGSGNHDMQSGLSACRRVRARSPRDRLQSDCSPPTAVELIAARAMTSSAAAEKAARLSGTQGAAPWINRRGAEAEWWHWRVRYRTSGRARELGIRHLAGPSLRWWLDIDVGPLLQTLKAAYFRIFRARSGYARASTPPNWKMMNLTGDSTGLDMVTSRRRSASRSRPRISFSAGRLRAQSGRDPQ